MAVRESQKVSKPEYSGLAEVVDYVPIGALEMALRVFKYGATKYDKDNWRTPPYFSKEKITDSLLRHLFTCIKDPYSVDADSGLCHAYHVLVNAMFLAEYVSNGWFPEMAVPKPKPTPTLQRDEKEASFQDVLKERVLEKMRKSMVDPVTVDRGRQHVLGTPGPEPRYVAVPRENVPTEDELQDVVSEFDADDFSQFLDEDE